MVIKRTPPRYPRRGPSCLLVLFVLFGIVVAIFVIQNADEVRDVIIPTPTPEPTRSAAEYALLADLSEQDGQLEEAIGFYQTAVELDTSKPEFFIRLVRLLIEVGQPEEALVRAEQLVLLAPEDDETWEVTAAAHIANGNRFDDLGDSTSAALEYAGAVDAARDAVNLNSSNATAYAYRAGGLVLQENPEFYAQAQEYADTAIFLDPNNPVARYYMATVFTYQGLYAAALEQYQLGLAADSQMAELHIGLAYSYFGNGQLADAILSFEDALEVSPNNAAAYDGLAYMFLQLGDDPLAEENALESVRLNPNVARARGRLGEAYFRQSNYEKAIEQLKVATELYSRPTELNVRFFNMLATAYIRASFDNCEQAIPLFQQVIDVTFNEFIIDDALEGLEECRRASLGTTP
jgi:superkiller protein 3